MYDILLKWGLETLKDVLSKEDEKTFSILKSAVDTKNKLVEKRFQLAVKACESLVCLNEKIDIDLSNFEKKTAIVKGTNSSFKDDQKKILELKGKEHFNEYKRIRTLLEGANDLLAVYSIRFSELLQLNKIELLCESMDTCSSDNIIECYRESWGMVADVIARLIRLTSTDLRFWLCDHPYAWAAAEQVENDCAIAKEFLISNKRDKYFELEVEKPEGMEKLWQQIEEKKENFR